MSRSPARSDGGDVRASSRVRLPDGSVVIIRRIHRTDGALLREHFDHLGDESRYRRFLGLVNHLSLDQVEYFTRPDHHRHEALFALDDDGHPVGVARYIGSSGDPATAEVAAAVVDDWQGRGVGRELLDRLAGAARAQGIRRFTALMLEGNGPMRHLLADLGTVETLDRDAGSIEVSVLLGSHRDSAPRERYTAAPTRAPMPAVSAMAAAPHTVTRATARPARAAPRRAPT